MNKENISWKREYTNWKDIVIVADTEPACVRVVAGGSYCWFSLRLSHRPNLTKWLDLFNGMVDSWWGPREGTLVKLDGSRLWVLCDTSQLSRLPGYRKVLEKSILPKVNNSFRKHLKNMVSRDSRLRLKKQEMLKRLKLSLIHA